MSFDKLSEQIREGFDKINVKLQALEVLINERVGTNNLSINDLPPTLNEAIDYWNMSLSDVERKKLRYYFYGDVLDDNRKLDDITRNIFCDYPCVFSITFNDLIKSCKLPYDLVIKMSDELTDDIKQELESYSQTKVINFDTYRFRLSVIELIDILDGDEQTLRNIRYEFCLPEEYHESHQVVLDALVRYLYLDSPQRISYTLNRLRKIYTTPGTDLEKWTEKVLNN